MDPLRVDLTQTRQPGWEPGRPVLVRNLWRIAERLTLRNAYCTSHRLKAAVLRRFGATVGTGVIFAPDVHVLFPWRLEIGDHAWIGEATWFDSLATISIGAHACVSQGAYLCTGNHDWSSRGMDMSAHPVIVEDGAWVGAFARIGPGVTVGREAVVSLGAVLTADAEPAGVYAGNPARRVADRRFQAS